MTVASSPSTRPEQTGDRTSGLTARYRFHARQILLTTLVMGVLLALGAPSVALAQLDYEDDHLQLELAPGALIDEINAEYGTTSADEFPPLHLLEVPEGEGVWVVLGEMEGDPRIVWAEPSYVNATPEALRSQVVGLVGGTIEDYEDQEVYGRLNLGLLHGHTTGTGAVIAILDTGVDGNHPALLGHVLPGYDFVDDDNDPSDTANGIDDDLDTLVDEGAGHGTMVAGIAHLVAPDAEILPIRVIDDEGSGRTFDVVKGIQYAIDHGAHVINLSLGLRTPCETLGRGVELAIDAGIVVVAAGGNDSSEIPPFFPAVLPGVHGVAALDSLDVKAEFSNYHESISVSAPGVGIRAPFLDDGWAIGAGTSFATPFIAGQAAVIIGETPNLLKSEADAIVQEGVVDVYGIPGNSPYYGKLGSGRIDGLETWNALQSPVAGTGPAPAELPGDHRSRGSWFVFPNPSDLSSDIQIVLRDAEPGESAQGARTESGPLTVVDVTGRSLRRLIPQFDGAGDRFARWDGRDDAGIPVPAGLYFVRSTATGGTARIVRVQR